MNAKYSLSNYAVAGFVAAITLVISACNDDFGYKNIEGKQITFKLIASDTWHEGMSVNENDPTTRCTSIKELSGGDTKLYLHAVVADNPAKEKTTVTRGTLINDKNSFIDTYEKFSLSAICYTGEWPEDESKNQWTTDFAHDLIYKNDGTPANPEKKENWLLWPSNGKVRFFAFAPTIEDFNNITNDITNDDGSLELSDKLQKGSLELSDKSQHKGSPTLTYTVPKDVTKQVDLMTVSKSVTAATTPDVELDFGHALTAVQIKCGSGMLAGKITEVTISGIYGTGTHVIGSDTWENQTDITSYTISKEISLPSDEGATDKTHVSEGTPIAGTETDNLTFMLLPQTLPEGATITIKLITGENNTELTLSASITGQKFEAGKIVTYKVSPSSISISPKLEFSKNGITDNNQTGDSIAYSGVWYDATFTATAEIMQAGEEKGTIENIPKDKVTFQYKFNDTDGWKNCTKDDNGLLIIEAQSAYTAMRNPFVTTAETYKDESAPHSLSDEYGETANCYMVDKAGYYSFPLVYGNGAVSGGHDDGLNYYPKHDDGKMPDDGKIADVSDAVLVWQDAPDLIDPASVKVDGDKLVFHIREHTLTQGNALLAVRNASKDIIWSWHIWVTPHKSEFYNNFYNSSPDSDYSYNLAQYNLGWCDSHVHNEARTFSLQAIIDMSAYGGSIETVDIGTFKQIDFKGSDAGDNTYYQWGRKDPMLGGVYNSYTPKYQYTKKATSLDVHEFTMENKQVFNQYNKDIYNYSFCKNLGDMIESKDEESKGVTIGYSIQHPYMFITNSMEYIEPLKGEPSDYNPATGRGYNPLTGDGFNFRNHWHVPYVVKNVNYLNAGTHIMFNVWNADAKGAGYEYKDVTKDNLKYNAGTVKKSVYDPCPPKFKVPPIHALRGIFNAISNNSASYSNHAWKITTNGSSITFPLTGVRNYALRPNEWKTVVPLKSTSNPNETFCKAFYKISMPAFSMLTFVSSSTIVKKDPWNAYQVYILSIDTNPRSVSNPVFNNLKKTITPSSNSYGLAVRPMHDE